MYMTFVYTANSSFKWVVTLTMYIKYHYQNPLVIQDVETKIESEIINHMTELGQKEGVCIQCCVHAIKGRYKCTLYILSGQRGAHTSCTHWIYGFKLIASPCNQSSNVTIVYNIIWIYKLNCLLLLFVCLFLAY